MCTLWDVSEEDLSGTRNDVCSGAAELGHEEVERKRHEEKERENTDSYQVHRIEELCMFTLSCKTSSHHFHQGVSTACLKLLCFCMSIHHKGLQFIAHI